MVIPVQGGTLVQRVERAFGRSVFLFCVFFTVRVIFEWACGNPSQIGNAIGATSTLAVLMALGPELPRRFLYGNWDEIRARRRALAAKRAELEREFGEGRRKGN